MSAPDASSLPGLSDTRLEEIEKAVTFITHEMDFGLLDAHDCGDDEEAEEYACAIDAVSDLLAEVRRLQGENEEMREEIADRADTETALNELQQQQHEEIQRLESALASAREETAQAVRAEREACAIELDTLANRAREEDVAESWRIGASRIRSRSHPDGADRAE